jgi:hypothetical protein
MDFSLFSIVTCTWNSEPYLKECIDSVLSQDYPHIEWIFVDGGSTDGTLERIRSLNRQYKLIENVQGGISHAMNVGMQAASGEIVVHLHSDDFLLGKDVLTKAHHLFCSTGCQWMFGRVLLSVNGKTMPEKYIPPRYSYSMLLGRNFIPHPATFARRELLINAGGYDTHLKYAMDYDMWLRLGRMAEPLQVHEPFAVFREHEGSLSTRERLSAMEEDYLVRRKYVGNHFFSGALHYARHIVRRRRIVRGLQQGKLISASNLQAENSMRSEHQRFFFINWKWDKTGWMSKLKK